MNLLPIYYRTQFTGLLRAPAFVAGVVALPSLIFLFVTGTARGDNNAIFASFTVFATLSVAFFQFGVGIAQDRDTPWERYRRILPASPLLPFAANILVALTFAAISVGLLAVVANFTLPLSITLANALRLALALVGGAIPMALLGIAIGYWVSARAALAVANVLYLALSFGGGIFVPPRALPPWLDAISIWLPTRRMVELAWSAVGGRPMLAEHWGMLAAYAVLFAALALWGYRRDEGNRYS